MTFSDLSYLMANMSHSNEPTSSVVLRSGGLLVDFCCDGRRVKKEEKKRVNLETVRYFGFQFLCSEIPPATATATVREARAGVTQGQARGG